MGYEDFRDSKGYCRYTEENIEDVVTENFHGMLDGTLRLVLASHTAIVFTAILIALKFHLSTTVQNFLKKCLAIRPEARMSAKEAFDHEVRSCAFYENKIALMENILIVYASSDVKWLNPCETGVSNAQNNAGRAGIRNDFSARKAWQKPIDMHKTTRALQQTHISPNTDSQNAARDDRQPRSQVKEATNAGKSRAKGKDEKARAGSDSKIKRGKK